MKNMSFPEALIYLMKDGRRSISSVQAKAENQNLSSIEFWFVLEPDLKRRQTSFKKFFEAKDWVPYSEEVYYGKRG